MRAGWRSRCSNGIPSAEPFESEVLSRLHVDHDSRGARGTSESMKLGRRSIGGAHDRPIERRQPICPSTTGIRSDFLQIGCTTTAAMGMTIPNRKASPSSDSGLSDPVERREGDAGTGLSTLLKTGRVLVNVATGQIPTVVNEHSTGTRGAERLMTNTAPNWAISTSRSTRIARPSASKECGAIGRGMPDGMTAVLTSLSNHLSSRSAPRRGRADLKSRAMYRAWWRLVGRQCRQPGRRLHSKWRGSVSSDAGPRRRRAQPSRSTRGSSSCPRVPCTNFGRLYSTGGGLRASAAIETPRACHGACSEPEMSARTA